MRCSGEKESEREREVKRHTHRMGRIVSFGKHLHSLSDQNGLTMVNYSFEHLKLRIVFRKLYI